MNQKTPHIEHGCPFAKCNPNQQPIMFQFNGHYQFKCPICKTQTEFKTTIAAAVRAWNDNGDDLIVARIYTEKEYFDLCRAEQKKHDLKQVKPFHFIEKLPKKKVKRLGNA